MSDNKAAKQLAKLDDKTRKIVDEILLRKKTGYFKLRINGDSMYPCLKDGDMVNVSAVDLNLIAPGDIIVYRAFESHLTAHRVVDVVRLGEGRARFITKGDNNGYVDRYGVDFGRVLGRVVQ